MGGTRTITFRPLREADCDLAASWRASPHVTRWFGDVENRAAAAALYREYVTGAARKQGFVIFVAGSPTGLIETFTIESHPYYFANLGVSEPHSVNMDLFIGPPELIGQGLGSLIIRQFVQTELFSSTRARACFAAPDVRNERAQSVRSSEQGSSELEMFRFQVTTLPLHFFESRPMTHNVMRGAAGRIGNTLDRQHR
jgi:aminoglycoside 6'-N-acetyltransferase